jgi:deoxyribose-phosphate aldolase
LENISRHLDLTLLNPVATLEDIEALVNAAKLNDIYAVCVSPTRVSDAVKFANGSGVKVASVVGFPSGAHSTGAKLYETKDALMNGASEIDMVANLAFIASGDWYAYQSELDAINSLVLEHGAVLKVILETALWGHETIATATKRAAEMSVGYIKTSTGYSPAGGASLDAVSIMLDNCGGSKIKASGGIRTLENAKSYLQIGVDRIGASSVSVLGREPSTANDGY